MAPGILSCPDIPDPRLYKDRDSVAYGILGDVWAVRNLAHLSFRSHSKWHAGVVLDFHLPLKGVLFCRAH